MLRMRDCGIESAPFTVGGLPFSMMWMRRLRRIWGRVLKSRKEDFVCAYIQRANGAGDLCGCKGQVLCDVSGVRRRCCGAMGRG